MHYTVTLKYGGKKMTERKDIDKLVDKALQGDIVDVQVNFQPSAQNALLCSYGHRIDIPTQFQDLGEPLRILLLRNMLWRKLQGYELPAVESGFTRGEFAHAISGQAILLQPLQMQFVPPPQGLFQVQLAMWRWQGALRRALQGDDISYDCAALNEAGRLLQSSLSERVSMDQLGSTFYSEPYSKTKITKDEIAQALQRTPPKQGTSMERCEMSVERCETDKTRKSEKSSVSVTHLLHQLPPTLHPITHTKSPAQRVQNTIHPII